MSDPAHTLTVVNGALGPQEVAALVAVLSALSAAAAAGEPGGTGSGRRSGWAGFERQLSASRVSGPVGWNAPGRPS